MNNFYDVLISKGITQEILRDKSDVFIIADDFFYDELRLTGLKFTCVKATENVKNLDSISPIIEILRESGVNRSTKIIAIGGGVVQDIVCFIASIYMRGIDWIYAPTTLLGMVDSCIGGKSSINIGDYKNLVGTFYPPKNIYIDPAMISTLNQEKRAAGLCEAAKITFAHGEEYFRKYLDFDAGTNSEINTLTNVIELSLLSKKWFVEVDEFDNKERLLLNFGHTFGHAIESASNYNISHGVAVGIGILCAISYHENRSGARGCGHQTEILRTIITRYLAEVPNLLRDVNDIQLNDFISAFNSDKKHNKDNYKIVVPNEFDKLELISVMRSEIFPISISAAFSSAVNYLKGKDRKA